MLLLIFYRPLNIAVAIFIFSDQDDIWECNKVEFFFQLVKGEQINEKLLIFSDASLIDECGNKIAGSFIKNKV